MSRKSLATVALLSAFVVSALAASAAQAAPHWYKKNVIVGSTPVTAKTVGVITLSTLGANIKCKVADAEEIWNPTTGGPGEDRMVGFALIKCKNPVASAACPKGPITVTAEGLPWRTVLTEAVPGTIRDEIQGVHLNVGCSNSAGTLGDLFEGTLEPEVVGNELVFGPGSGTLFDSFLNPLTITGFDKILAPPGKIAAKNP